MNWNDLQSIWHRQDEPTLAVLKHTFEVKHRKMAKVLFWRDTREAAAGLSVACFFAFETWKRGRAYWPVYISVALTLGVTCFYVWERLRARRNRLGPEAALVAKLEADIAELRHQRHLLANLMTWILVPIVAAAAIALVTVSINQGTHSWLRTNPRNFWIYIGSWVPLIWGVRALNRRAVRKKIEPRIFELQKLHDDLLSSK